VLLRDPLCIILPNFAKIGQTVEEISRFLWFSRWWPPPCWIFILRNFNGRFAIYGANLRLPTKFNQNRLNGCRDMEFWGFFAVLLPNLCNVCSRHVGFLTIKLLAVAAVKKRILSHRTKFRKDRSNRSEISRFLWFSRRRPPLSWISKNRSNGCRDMAI